MAAAKKPKGGARRIGQKGVVAGAASRNKMKSEAKGKITNPGTGGRGGLNKGGNRINKPKGGIKRQPGARGGGGGGGGDLADDVGVER